MISFLMGLSLMAEGDMDSQTATIITIAAIGISLVFIVIMAFGARRDRRRLRQAAANKDKLTPEIFDGVIKNAFQKAGKRSRFTIYYMQLIDAGDIAAAFGEDIFDEAVINMMSRLEKTFPWRVKICRYQRDAIAIFTDEEMNAKELREHAEYMVFEGKKTHVMAANLRFNMLFNIAVNEKNEFSPTEEEFWQNMRIALDAAKRSGPNTYAVYSLELTDRETEEYKFYKEIKQAIEDKEFTLYYQPIKDVRTGSIFGYESLLRWNHKTLGVLAPSRYLKIMEQSGDINWVGIWAFEQLVKQYIQWKKGSHLLMTMNLSQKQLLNDKLSEELRRISKKYRVPNNDFCFEIAEFDMQGKTDDIKSNISKLKQAGFLVAINSYGLEVNSIAMLEKIDIDMIKLDNDFIRRAKDNFVLGGVLGMLKQYAEKKSAYVVAENTETEEELKLAEEMGIDYVQGYYFGIPKSPEEIANEG